MKTTKIFLPLLLGLALLFSACGGGGGENSAAVQESETQEAAAPAKKEMSPSEMGETIGEIYIEALQDIVELLKDKPEASTIRPQVEVLKEKYVQELVALGRLKESLSDSEKSVVNSRVTQKAYSIGKEPWYAAFNEIQQHYFSDQEFHKLVISFNIITQYADFELLKKQEPEEAVRLGIQ